MKTKEISGNVTNIILEEEAVCLEFSESYPYCWIENRSDGDVLIALDKEPVKGADGTYLAASGSNVRIPCGFGHKPVLFGSGEVQAIASVIAECPFKSKAKGGGLSVLEYIDIVSAGVTTYDGYDDGSLTMIAANNTWQTLRFKNGSIVNVLTGELTLTREEGLIAHSVQFQTEVSGEVVLLSRLQDLTISKAALFFRHDTKDNGMPLGMIKANTRASINARLQRLLRRSLRRSQING